MITTNRFALCAFVICLTLTSTASRPLDDIEQAGAAFAARSTVSTTESQIDAPNRHWALLIAGSRSYANYRHQADVYHAYQILHQHGIAPERMVVMHYDDIAYNGQNPHPGVVINNPKAEDVYHDVPKDYVGKDVNAKTFLSVLAGDKDAVQNVGSGKVIASGPNDKVFVYYADHGSPGILGMPSGPYLYAPDLIETIKNKKAEGGFKEMVMYVEACESGSMFDGLLPEDLDVFVTTAANDFESSWGYYCPASRAPPPIEYTTCLGDKYSISWLEDSDTILSHPVETLQEQYLKVKERTGAHLFQPGSHVMEFGTMRISGEPVLAWIGNGSEVVRRGDVKEEETENIQVTHEDEESEGNIGGVDSKAEDTATAAEWSEDQDQDKGAESYWEEDAVSVAVKLQSGEVHDVGGRLCGQHAATLLHYQTRVSRLGEGSEERSAAQKDLDEILHQYQAREQSIRALVQHFIAPQVGNDGNASEQPGQVSVPWPMKKRQSGQSLVDDWSCFKDSIQAWENSCGPLGEFGMRHTRVFAHLCNNGVKSSMVAKASALVCPHSAVE